MDAFGIQFFISEWLPDGELIGIEGAVFLGVVTETDNQHEARSIVRRGLRDELYQLGMPTRTGREILEAVRATKR